MGCMGMDSKLRTKPKALFGGFEGLSKAPGSRCKISSIWGRISWLISTSEPIFVSILTLFGPFFMFFMFQTFFCIFTPFSAFFCNSLYTFFNLMDSLHSPGLYRFENAFSRFKKKKKKKKKKEDNSPSLFFGHRFPS